MLIGVARVLVGEREGEREGEMDRQEKKGVAKGTKDLFSQSKHLPSSPSQLSLRIQIPRHRAPQFPPALARNIDDILQVVAGGDSHAADKVLGHGLEVVGAGERVRHVVFGSAKVRVG